MTRLIYVMFALLIHFLFVTISIPFKVPEMEENAFSQTSWCRFLGNQNLTQICESKIKQKCKFTQAILNYVQIADTA